MASSNTLLRPVSFKVFEGNLVRNVVSIRRPRARMGVELSSVRVRRTGTQRGQAEEIREL